MCDTGFVKGQSDNLPNIDSFMMASYFGSNPDFVGVEIRGAKAAGSSRENYGDNAIGFVQVKRENSLCFVKAKVTPEHRVRKTGYNVELICDEEKETIQSVQCQDCAASLGGCKHAVAFLTWLHRRSEEAATTETVCYWKKSTLAAVGTTKKFLLVSELGKSVEDQDQEGASTTFFNETIDYFKRNNLTKTQLSKYFIEPLDISKASIHKLLIDYKYEKNGSNDANKFLEHCKSTIPADIYPQIAEETTNQADCPLWHEMRYGRITASKIYDVANCKKVDGIVVEQLIGAKKIKDTAALARGRRLESEVLNVLQKKMKKHIETVGFFIDGSIPILGASPDGLLGNMVIEVKCPTSKKSEERYYKKDGNITAKYFAQVQIQMHVLNKSTAIFCVASYDFEESKQFKEIIVHYDAQFCKNIIQKAVDFWKIAVFPILYNI